jgi:beta-glucosidase
VLRVKLALGLFEHPFVDEAAAGKALYMPATLATAESAAERSLVLLKNESVGGKPLLPLAKDVQNIALIGPLSVGYKPSDPAEKGLRVSLAAAIMQRIGAGHLSTFHGSGVVDGSDEEISAAVDGAKKADLIILALGEDPDMSGEAASRAHLGLPGRQQELLEAVVKTGKPVVLILFSGRPLTLPWAFERVPAVIAAFFPGIETGPAIARTLFGQVSPAGRLVVSWPRSVGQEPLYYNALNTGRPSGDVDLTHRGTKTEERYLSRYIDEQNSPQFPFGYGLTYTSFTYGATRIGKRSLSAGELNHELHAQSRAVDVIEAEVSNTGSRAGEEVVQLYVGLRGTSTAQPVRALKGFQRIALAAGEKKMVKFDLAPEALAIWNDQNRFAAEPAKVSVWISPDAAHGSPAEMEIIP